MMRTGKDKKIFDLERVVLDTKSRNELLQRRLSAYETDGVAVGAGLVLDLNQKVQQLQMRGEWLDKEVDRLKGFEQFEWRYKEKLLQYQKSQRFRASEKLIFEKLEKEHAETIKLLEAEKQKVEKVKVEAQVKYDHRDKEFSKRVRYRFVDHHVWLLTRCFFFVPQMSFLQNENNKLIDECNKCKRTLEFEVCLCC